MDRSTKKILWILGAESALAILGGGLVMATATDLSGLGGFWVFAAGVLGLLVVLVIAAVVAYKDSRRT